MEILLSRGAGLKHPQLSVPELLVDSGSTYLQGRDREGVRAPDPGVRESAFQEGRRLQGKNGGSRAVRR